MQVVKSIKLKHVLALSIVCSCLLISSCSTLDLVNAFSADSGSVAQRGIAYGGDPRQKLDFYSPESPLDSAVVFIFFYGGGWDSGNRADYEFVARTLAARGHFVVVPDYRLYPLVVFPQFVEDGALATAFVLDNLPDLTGKQMPVFLMGHSAGAHIAMLLAMDDRYLATLAHETEEISGVIGLAGPYDFLPITSSHLERIFPSPGRYESQPINFADSGDPPALLAHGDQDARVRLENSVNMTQVICRNGGDVTLKIYPDTTHAGLLKPFVSFMDDDIQLLDDLMKFVSQKLVHIEARADPPPMQQGLPARFEGSGSIWFSIPIGSGLQVEAPVH